MPCVMLSTSLWKLPNPRYLFHHPDTRDGWHLPPSCFTGSNASIHPVIADTTSGSKAFKETVLKSMANDSVASKQRMFTPVSVEQLRSSLSHFAQERQWEKFHTPRNILLALVAEVGELSELFQWRGEVAANLPEFSDAEKLHVGQELSDVLLYLIRLSDVCGIDLGKAALDKLAHNAAKYPADKCRGKSDKYTAYSEQDNSITVQHLSHTQHQQGHPIADQQHHPLISATAASASAAAQTTVPEAAHHT